MQTRSFDPFPTLVTARLVLRALHDDDCERFFTLRSDPLVLRYMNRAPLVTLQAAQAQLDWLREGQRDGRWVIWALCRPDDDALMGTACLWNFDGSQGAEVGYDLLPAYQGKGYMAEALDAVLGYGFGTLALRRIEARTHPDNIPSRRLLEGLGFGMVGVEGPEEAGEYEPNVIYELYEPNLYSEQREGISRL